MINLLQHLAMVLRSACGACMCQNHVGGCEPGFTCMTDQGFVSEDGPYCVHESVLSSNGATAGNVRSADNTAPSVRSADVASGNTQGSVAGTDVSVDPGKIVLFVTEYQQ